MTLDPLIVDMYAGDGYGGPAIAKLAAAGPPWHGLVMKATEGTYYPRGKSTDYEWFLDNWFRARVYAGNRYGVDWFRGAYHYLRVDEDGADQAKAFLSLVTEAGGWGAGDLQPILDVESAENPANASAAQVEDAIGEFTGCIYTELGRPTTLYGNVYLAERGYTYRPEHGVDTLIVARYASTLPPVIYHRIGWQLPIPAVKPTVFAWQLCGDGEVYVPGYPKETPMGKCDYSSIIVGNGGNPEMALAWTRDNMLPPQAS